MSKGLGSQASCNLRPDLLQQHLRVRVLPDGRMTRQDAATYLGLRPKTLANWKLQGKGPPPIIVGRRCFYMRDDLDEFVAAGKSTPRTNGS